MVVDLFNWDVFYRNLLEPMFFFVTFAEEKQSEYAL